jgi:hypothetical protein
MPSSPHERQNFAGDPANQASQYPVVLPEGHIAATHPQTATPPKKLMNPGKFLAVTSFILSCIPLFSEIGFLNIFAPDKYALPTPISWLFARFASLFGFAPILGVSGIVTGSVALYLNSKSNKSRGTLWLAIIGVVLGALVLLALAVGVVVLIYLALTTPLND